MTEGLYFTHTVRASTPCSAHPPSPFIDFNYIAPFIAVLRTLKRVSDNGEPEADRCQLLLLTFYKCLCLFTHYITVREIAVCKSGFVCFSDCTHTVRSNRPAVLLGQVE